MLEWPNSVVLTLTKLSVTPAWCHGNMLEFVSKTVTGNTGGWGLAAKMFKFHIGYLIGPSEIGMEFKIWMA